MAKRKFRGDRFRKVILTSLASTTGFALFVGLCIGITYIPPVSWITPEPSHQMPALDISAGRFCIGFISLFVTAIVGYIFIRPVFITLYDGIGMLYDYIFPEEEKPEEEK